MYKIRMGWSMFLDILKVTLLSIIEAFTEFIPVSSTGHMIIVDHFIKLSHNAEFVNAFEIIIQLGAILAVVFIFYNKLNPFLYKGNKRIEIIDLWFKIVVAVLPAVILGLLFDNYISSKLFNVKVVSINLIIYGLLLIIIKGKNTSINLVNLTYKKAFFIGLFQCLAMIPGTSRSAVTIIGAMLLGLNRVSATDFSFFLAIPTMIGATSLKLLKIGNILSFYELSLIFIGFVLTFLFSLVIIRVFLRYIKNNDFKVFGYYRIVLGLILLIYLYLG